MALDSILASLPAKLVGVPSAQALQPIIDQLATAAFDMRKQTGLAAAIAQRTLLAIAANAKRRG